MIEKIDNIDVKDISTYTRHSWRNISLITADLAKTIEKLNEVIASLNKMPQWSYTDVGTESITTGGNSRTIVDTSPGGVPFCNCHQYRTGEITGGWICPRHGHQL